MDLNDVRSLVTLVSLVLFIGLMVWTWWPSRRGAHEDASMMLFGDELTAAQQRVDNEVPR